MAKSLFSAIAALALAIFAPTAAHAVTLDTFDFTAKNPDGTYKYLVSTSGSNVGNSMVFKSNSNQNLLVKITAWSIDRINNTTTTINNVKATDNDMVTAATLRLWDGGLGVQNIYEPNSSPNHSIDNGTDLSNITSGSTKYMVDFVLLQFNFDAELESFGTGWVSGDQDASLRVGTGFTNNVSLWQTTQVQNNKPYDDSKANTTTDLTNFLKTGIGDSTISGAAAGSPADNRIVNTDNKHGMTWLLGALYGSQSDDYFKLDALRMTTLPLVPEPSTWMTMILGFGFVGWSMRRSKVSFGKTAHSAA